MRSAASAPSAGWMLSQFPLPVVIRIAQISYITTTSDLDAGARAPDFTLQTDDGSTVRLKELRGRPVVLYFYPKDDTPGCTVEACEFRDALPKFEKIGALIYGV